MSGMKGFPLETLCCCFYCSKICLCSCFLNGVDMLIFWCGTCCCYCLYSCVENGVLCIYSTALSSSWFWPQQYMICLEVFNSALQQSLAHSYLATILQIFLKHSSIIFNCMLQCAAVLSSYSEDHRQLHNIKDSLPLF